MVRTPASVLLRHVRRLAADEAAPDAELVRTFLARRDEAAFAALVRRHGPMVLAVCRSVLRHLQDAEDAFQATFLLLARKAASIRKPAAVGSWLHGAAYRLALNARAAAARRLTHEQAVPPRPSTADDITWGELRQVLHEELARLPERFRAPLLLCYLEGLTQDEAAVRLGWPAPTLKGRLNRGRDLLRRRLARRGFALSAPLFAALFAGGEAEALPLAAALVEGAVAGALGIAPARVVALADGLVRWGFSAKLKAMLAVLLAAGALAAGAAALRSPPAEVPPEEPARPAPVEDKPAERATKEPPAKADGDPLPEGALARLGSRRLRHPGAVQTVAFSPDGKLLLLAGGSAVRLWDAVSGKAVRQIPKPCNAPAFSPDGKWLAVAEDGKTIVLHEVARGESRRRIGTCDEMVTVLAFSRDGKWLASGGTGDTLIVWDVAGAKRKHQLRVRDGRRQPCRSVAFSPDGKFLTDAEWFGHASTWDARTGELLYDFSAAAVSFSPDGKLLAARDLAGRLHLLDPASGKEVGEMTVERSGRAVSVAFSPDGKLLATGGDEALRLYDVASRRQLHEEAANHLGTPHVAFSPDGKALASTAGYAVRVWELPSWKERFPSEDHTTQIDALAYSPDGRTLATGGTYDNRLLLWDLSTGKPRRALDCEKQGVFCAAFSPDGRSLAAGLTENGPGHTVGGVWDTASGKRLHRLDSQFGATAVAFSADGKRLAAGDSGIFVWDAKSGERLALMQPNEKRIHSLAFTSQGRSVLFTSIGWTPSEWDVATAKELRQFEGKRLPDFLRMAVSPTGRFVAVGWRHGTETTQKNPIRIWEVATGKEVAALCPDDSWAEEVAISADGRLIACLRHDATIRVHDLLTGEELRRFHDPALPKVIAFGPDGKTLASAGWDTTVTLWDVKDLAKKASRAEPLSRDRLAALWSDLDGDDGAKAYAAVRALARVPEQAVPLLRERLARPAPAGGQVAKLIAELDDDEYDVRERASAELEKVGGAAGAALRKALEGKPSAEAKRRIEALLAKGSPTGVSPEQVTALRALEVLELAGTPEARRLIKSLAEGPGGAPITAEAPETLERMGR